MPCDGRKETRDNALHLPWAKTQSLLQAHGQVHLG